MINLNQILSEINSSKDYEEKNQMLTLLVSTIKSKRFKPSKNDKSILSDFAFHEIREIISVVESMESYKEKSRIFRYADTFYFLIMAVHKSPAELSAEKIALTKELNSLMEKELYLEQKLENMFSQDIISVSDVNDLLERLSETKDEYEKGLFYAGLLHYRNDIPKFLESSKLNISGYMAKELARYIAEYADDEDKKHAMEALCDAAYYFIDDEIINLLYKVLELDENSLVYYAAVSLLKSKKDIPEKNIYSLANDLVYADRFYSALKAEGKETLFPSELAAEEYLAKSDLVQWLTYPSELGKVPDQIEYIGKTEVKKEVFHIFKFKSDSDNLGDDLKNKWLIGWSSVDGGTFSHFQEYEKFEKETTEKTVKNIKKKIL